ncbi:energy-coupled thiamine transporter ThiT [Mesoplasma corruscae]|uniref:Thiamine transporter n=1 Tax=Mesoplasma corruscae TaxID=216874 RepID=A0A2S5RH66_9MOLU|nr:energy-coupled thiamine transporter ThiT [Mesoplasma corruscae]PPE06638.1 hypothetical protein MCORR_v1c02690 [Mesoplasma corruscae]
MEKHFFINVKRLRTKDIAIMGTMLSIYVILNATTAFSFSIFFLSFNLKLIPIFILAAYTDWLRTLIIGLIGGLIGYFLPTNADAGIPLAYIFDYYFPLLFVSFCSVLLPRNYKKIINYSNFYNSFIGHFWGVIKTFFIWLWQQKIFVLVLAIYVIMSYCSKIIGGVLFWSAGKPEGDNVWIWSMIYNIPNSINNFIFFVLFIPITCYTIEPIRKQIY